MVWSASMLLVSTSLAWADMQGTGESGGWEKRIAVKPDPSKVVVPEGYEVGILVEGLNAPSAATVDGEGNLWVVVSPPLLGSPDAEDELFPLEGPADEARPEGAPEATSTPALPDPDHREPRR
jgi:hypothetical protein